MEEILQMSEKEIDRYHIIKQVINKQMTQGQAAVLMGIQTRQVRNLLSVVKKEGKKGLISKRRGKPSNRKYNTEFRDTVTRLVREKYPDFGPTFAVEKLKERHFISISIETLRSWMIQEKLWLPRKRRSQRHPPRSRRDFFGELIQIDSSTHDWFEGRGKKCALVVFIDDATSLVTALHFCPSECLEGYFIALNKHIIRYGKPRGLYSDRHSIFGGSDKIHHANFIRALKELDIQSILAKSPQAKGRVERVNRTLQDRLIKEMRLNGINNIEDANKFLEGFLREFNNKFSKEPRGQVDAHRPLDSGINLERILTRFEERTVTKDMCISIDNRFYKIVEPSISNRLKLQKVEVRRNHQGSFRLYFKDKELKYVPIDQYTDKTILDVKEKLVWNPGRTGHKPNSNHPWKRFNPCQESNQQDRKVS